jgi:hypothetical protein
MADNQGWSSKWAHLNIKVNRAQDWNVQFSIKGAQFVDEHGRTLLLRGINLCGNSKLPTSPNSYVPCEEFYSSCKDVSFVGRPFMLAEAKEHFQRLRTWGLTFARLLVPWEALGKLRSVSLINLLLILQSTRGQESTTMRTLTICSRSWISRSTTASNASLVGLFAIVRVLTSC